MTAVAVPDRIVAVTGATGFLGRRLIRALAADGWRARILIRRAGDGDWSEDAPGADLAFVVGDLDDPAALSRLMAGAGVVIHGAGLIKARDRSAFFDINAEGSRRLAHAVGPGRMIMISSLAAREPQLSDYAGSKRAGEIAARDVLGDRLQVLRPPAIYGPGDRETLGLFQLAAASPVMPTPADRAARLALAHADDVAGELVGRLTAPWTPGVFAIGGARPSGYAWREIFQAAARAMSRTPRLVSLPGGLIRGAAAVSEVAAALRGAPAIFTRGKARELLHADWSVPDIERPPGPAWPHRDLESGFRDTVAWYEDHGWLPKRPAGRA